MGKAQVNKGLAVVKIYYSTEEPFENLNIDSKKVPVWIARQLATDYLRYLHIEATKPPVKVPKHV